MIKFNKINFEICCVAFVVFNSPVQATVQTCNGKWWLSVPPEERDGFLSGYSDCELYDARERRFGSFVTSSMVLNITNYFQAHPSQSEKLVVDVLSEIQSQGRPKNPVKGNTREERHGGYDGEYWRQAGYYHRLGFIKGYLLCQAIYGKPLARFPKPFEWYVSQISQWYGIKQEDESEINMNRINVKIADVLFRFRDRSEVKTGLTKSPKGN